jgi:hypothetical protein
MLNESEMRSELDKLSSEAIAQIRDALHDLLAAPIRRAAMACLWQRHGVAVTEWPLNYHTPSQIAYCSHSVSHAPVRHLNWSYDVEGSPRIFWEWECSCGRSTSAVDDRLRLYLKWRQVRPIARAWPIVAHEGFPHYRVCKNSTTAEDAYHAPTGELAWMCLCGATIGGNDDKYLPVY